MTKENNPALAGLDQIREILVGDDRRQYDRRIKELSERVDRLEQTMNERFERMEAEHRRDVRALLDAERDRLSGLFGHIAQAIGGAATVDG